VVCTDTKRLANERREGCQLDDKYPACRADAGSARTMRQTKDGSFVEMAQITAEASTQGLSVIPHANSNRRIRLNFTIGGQTRPLCNQCRALARTWSEGVAGLTLRHTTPNGTAACPVCPTKDAIAESCKRQSETRCRTFG
jgi:hypothetical protein